MIGTVTTIALFSAGLVVFAGAALILRKSDSELIRLCFWYVFVVSLASGGLGMLVAGGITVGIPLTYLMVGGSFVLIAFLLFLMKYFHVRLLPLGETWFTRSFLHLAHGFPLLVATMLVLGLLPFNDYFSLMGIFPLALVTLLCLGLLGFGLLLLNSLFGDKDE